MANLGSTRRIEAEFTADGVPTDPTTTTLTVTAPDGTETTPAPTHDGDGEYHHDQLLDQSGRWTFAWVGTGDVPASFTETIIVLDPAKTGGAGVCEPWITWDDVTLLCSNAPTFPDETAETMQAIALDYAQTIVDALSCDQFGVCIIAASPCSTRCLQLCRHGRRCSCGRYEKVRLGTEPIVQVFSVTIDGERLDPSAYRVDDFEWLVRTDDDVWPRCQDMEAAAGSDSTWEVEWAYGRPIDNAARLALAMFTCQIGKQILDDDDCELPPGTTTASRDGVTVNIIDTEEAIAKGKTGVRLTDFWLSTVCPQGLDPGAGAFDPGRGADFVQKGT